MEQFCPWEQAQYFIYSDNIPTLFFYSHIPAIIIALLVGFLVFYKSNKSGVGVTLLLITLLFSIWSIFDLILWATNRPDIVMFFWSLQILIEPLIYLLGFYLTYLFITNKDLGFKAKLLGLALYSPIVFLLPSAYNLVGVEFLLAFSWGNLIRSFTDNWTLAQFGLIGMPIFVAFLAYLIVKFHTFNIKLIATQVLMVSLWFLVLGILFIRNINNVRVVTLFTLFLVTVVGYLLVKSVKKEIERKEELAKLNIELQDSIKQRESLVHLVTHKVKGSFTRSKYIFAGIIDGTFGIVSPSIKKYAEQGLESDNMGIETVDLVLNADNLQKGTVKYDMKSIDFKEIVLKAIEEKRGPIEMKGLKIENTIKDGNYTILGDTFWLKEAVHNLIENSIQYTKTGGIVVGLSDGNGKVVLSVKDTGVGINDEDKKSLFTEGGRGRDSVKINVDSTGYGLYTVKLVVEAHKGRVWAQSEGTGKGSTFYVELDAVA